MPHHGWLALVALTTMVAVRAEAARNTPASRPEEPGTALCLAESSDGLQFTSRNEVLITGAAHPGLVQLPNKHLLAVFEHRPPAQQDSSPDSPPESSAQIHHGGTADRDPPGLWATRSTDAGKTWLPARPIRLAGLPEGTQVGRPSLVLMPSGLARLYFALSDKPDRSRARARAGAFVGSAVTRDGLEYRVDRQVRIPCRDLESPRLSAFWTDKQLVLLVTAQPEPAGKPTSSMVQQFLSNDGRTFSAPERARFAGEIGNVVRLDQHHWRMFIGTGGEIRSRMSNDGIRWRDEADVCLGGGLDPAVAQIDKSMFIMLFASRLTAESAKLPGLAAIEEARPKDAGNSVAANSSESVAKASSEKETSSGESQTAGWESFAPGGYESELGADWTASGDPQSESGSANDFGLAPLPDFYNKFDYIAWFEQNCGLPDDQNAASGYADALATLKSYPDGTLKHMYNDDTFSGPPVPWNGATRPEWEASYLATQDLIAQFRSGSEDPRAYSCPLIWSENKPPEDRMLIDLLLPNLAGFRTMAKATLGQAWRAPNGIVPPEQMRSALGAVLGNVAHLQQGPTTIERLVSVAEQRLANDEALSALARGVFPSAEDIEATLDTLRTKDPGDPDPGGFIRSEHAWCMDMLQSLFKADTPGGEPQLQLDRVEKLFGLIDEEGHAAISKMHIDAGASAEAMDGYLRQMLDFYRTNYPYESPHQFADLAVQIKNEHPITGLMLPSLARAGELMRRTEATRRATQLTYSVELFRAQNGRYPGSLDELPSDQVSDVRTDPYSRQDFAYRFTDSGVMIYSVGENGQDDGGAHSHSWGDDKKEGEGDDYIFWPPQE